ncbi:MAG: hypothetical protein MUO76_09295 [Anaerolineaceae bacterium]|jgi:hypothetical protein|nr:hypothetical protein [Anaerolineaceae bacterium]
MNNLFMSRALDGDNDIKKFVNFSAKNAWHLSLKIYPGRAAHILYYLVYQGRNPIWMDSFYA